MPSHTKLTHHVVMKYLKKIKSIYPGVDPIDIAKNTELDTRTVKLHLDLLEMHGYGRWADRRRKIFLYVNP